MRRKAYNKQLNKSKFQYAYFIIVLFIFICGITTGVFTSTMMDPSSKTDLYIFISDMLLSSQFSDVSNSNIFLASAQNNILLLLLIGGLSFSVFLSPFILVVILTKGFSLGLTTGVLISIMKLDGFVAVLLTILPQNIIIVPITLIAGFYGIDFASNIFKTRKNGIKMSLRNSSAQFILFFLLMMVLILLGSFIEAYIIPFLLTIIY